ncbi:MAG: hypothetical protein E4H36_00550 [Spirochaetales bacterium]|nr:MAG: hypothetical protein E4H36_00550 [Spirochaetales bacterium]
MKKQFFCENCNRSVPKEALTCPHCGSSFQAVKCPKCGFTGNTDMFAAGCPICGYLSDSFARRTVKPAESLTPQPSHIPETKRKKALPDWFYPVAGVILLGIIIAIVIMYLKL